MIFFPEKHSYQIYKASILDIIENQNKKNTHLSPNPQEYMNNQDNREVHEEETSS